MGPPHLRDRRASPFKQCALPTSAMAMWGLKLHSFSKNRYNTLGCNEHGTLTLPPITSRWYGTIHCILNEFSVSSEACCGRFNIVRWCTIRSTSLRNIANECTAANADVWDYIATWGMRHHIKQPSYCYWWCWCRGYTWVGLNNCWFRGVDGMVK